MPLKKYRNEKSLKEDFKYLKPILQMRTRPSYQDEILLKKLKRLIKLNKVFKISKIDNYIFEVWYKHCWELVYRCINDFSGYEKVITSRLHGHILTCLLERNSVLLNNSYGKNKAYYELWTKELAEYIDQSS